MNVTSAGAQSGRAELSQFRPVVERDEPLRQAIAAGAAAAARPSVEAEQDAQLRASLELLGTPRCRSAQDGRAVRVGCVNSIRLEIAAHVGHAAATWRERRSAALAT